MTAGDVSDQRHSDCMKGVLQVRGTFVHSLLERFSASNVSAQTSRIVAGGASPCSSKVLHLVYHLTQMKFDILPLTPSQSKRQEIM